MLDYHILLLPSIMGVKNINLFELYASIAIDTSEYERDIKGAVKSSDKASRSLKGMAEKAASTKNKVKVLTEQFKKADANVRELTKAFNQQVKKTGAASQEAQVLAKKLNDAEKEASQLKSELQSYSKAAKKAGDSSKSFGEKLKTGFSNFGKFIAGIGAAAGTVVGVIASLDGATEDYRKAMGKSKTAYDAANMSTKAANTAYTEFYKILGDTDTATEAAQLLSKLTRNEQNITKWTRIAAGVYGTFGDSLPIEALIESINETARAGQITGNLADALNWASLEGETFGVTLKSNTKKNKEWNEAVKNAETAEDYFNLALQACTSEVERNQLIMDTLAKTYDSASDAFYANNQELIKQRETQAKLDASLAKIGESVSKLKTKFLTELEPAISMGSEKISEFIDNFDIEEAKDKLSDLVAVFQILLPIIVGATAAMGAYKAASAIAGVIDALRAATESQTIAQALLNAVMNANPFVLVATLIAGLVTALVTLYMTNEDFRNKVQEIWGSISAFFQNVVEKIRIFFTETIPKAILNTLLFFEDVKNKALTWGKDLIQNFINGIQAKWQALKDKVSSLAGMVKDYLGFSEPEKGPLSNFHTYAPDMMDLFAKGIKDNEGMLARQIESTFNLQPKIAAATATGYGTATNSKGTYDAMLDRIIGIIRSMDWTITLDDGTLVGRIDDELGKRETHERRGS